jgi:hypothetical protein
MPWRPVIYLHRGGGDGTETSGPSELLPFTAELAVFESLPALLVGSLASTDITANEFVS